MLNDSAKLPVQATVSSSGYDLCSSEEMILAAKSYALIPTGLVIEMPHGMEAQVRPRSGLAVKNGITVLNSPGTIDADYRGEVKVALINHSAADFRIEKGARIAQLVFCSVQNIRLICSEKLSDSERGAGGFGSTGIH